MTKYSFSITSGNTIHLYAQNANIRKDIFVPLEFGGYLLTIDIGGERIGKCWFSSIWYYCVCFNDYLSVSIYFTILEQKLHSKLVFIFQISTLFKTASFKQRLFQETSQRKLPIIKQNSLIQSSIVDTWIILNNMKSPYFKCTVVFWSMTTCIYSGTLHSFYITLSLQNWTLIPILPILPKYDRFIYKICNRFVMLHVMDDHPHSSIVQALLSVINS